MRKPKILATGSTGKTGTPPQGDRLLQAATNVAIAARDEGVQGLVNMQAPQSSPEFVRANRARFTGELQEVS